MKWSESHCFTPLSDFGSANLVRTTKIHILRFGSANQVRQKFGSGVIVLSRGHSQRVLSTYLRIYPATEELEQYCTPCRIVLLTQIIFS